MAASLVHALFLDFENERIPRNYLKNRLSAFVIPDAEFKRTFRLDKESVIYLCDKLQNFLKPSRIPGNVRVLAALRFFATGSYQGSIANDMYISLCQQSVSNCIRDVSKAICTHLSKEYIRFPRSDEELQSVKTKFYTASGFPGVIGAIDCTHVAIVTPPSTDSSAASYMNRKGFTSMNVQLIVDSDLRILAINAKFPGSVHDSFIWRHSTAREHISRIDNGWLLGDSGYPLEPWLMTPFPNSAIGSVEEIYNFKHASARSCVERCNGVLKTRFRCLLKHRVLHYSPTTAGQIINACATLHNICISRNIPIDENVDSFSNDLFSESDMHSTAGDANNHARNIRYRLALSFA